jgi:hypothetical protein
MFSGVSLDAAMGHLLFDVMWTLTTLILYLLMIWTFIEQLNILDIADVYWRMLMRHFGNCAELQLMLMMCLRGKGTVTVVDTASLHINCGTSIICTVVWGPIFHAGETTLLMVHVSSVYSVFNMNTTSVAFGGGELSDSGTCYLGKGPRHLLDRRLGVPQNWSRRYWGTNRSLCLNLNNLN